MKLLLKPQQGQSMVEYIVVVFFSVMLLLAPLYDPDKGDKTFSKFDYALKKNSSGRNLNSIEVVQAVMQDNYRGYSYAMSLSEYPDYLPLQAQQQTLNDFNDSLKNLNGAKSAAIQYVKDNVPPKLPAFKFPGLPPKL